MAAGEFPPGTPLEAQQQLEPLCLWLPNLLPPWAPSLSASARRTYCQVLLLKQDDAWKALVQRS